CCLCTFPTRRAPHLFPYTTLFRSIAQGLQDVALGPREQGRVDLEAGVLRRRPDEGEEPGLDVRQQGILLGLVEAMDLVHEQDGLDRKSTRLNSSHVKISYAVFCLE